MELEEKLVELEGERLINKQAQRDLAATEYEKRQFAEAVQELERQLLEVREERSEYKEMLEGTEENLKEWYVWWRKPRPSVGVQADLPVLVPASDRPKTEATPRRGDSGTPRGQRKKW